MTKAMTVAERRKAKKAHAALHGQIEALAAPTPAPSMRPTPEARAKSAFRVEQADAKGAKHYRRQITCRLDMLAHRGAVTRQQCEAGKRYEADHRLAWGSAGRDSTQPGMGGVGHETEAQADRIARAKARMNRVLNLCGPAAFAILRSVAAYDASLGRQNCKAVVARYLALKAALDAAAEVYGVPEYAV